MEVWGRDSHPFNNEIKREKKVRERIRKGGEKCRSDCSSRNVQKYIRDFSLAFHLSIGLIIFEFNI